ncbi:MAG: class I SAM-dependent methyltransferase [Cyanobacteria bacterium K_DeepCast_35m_m1_288]|nr:class I SAM-dependent methyltransferase [Cyanobacteria bacterium K_DeepCast_35m_m1_288]
MSLAAHNHLRCPSSGEPLGLEGDALHTGDGISYPIVHGVPVLLPPTERPTLWVATASRQQAGANPSDPWQLGTIGLSPRELAELKSRVEAHLTTPEPIDPVVSFLIGATNGHLYDQLRGQLRSLPIPALRLPRARGNELLLDVGCSWGRWSIAAARAGYQVIGIDPSLGAVLAGQRLAKAMGLDQRIQFVCGDALRLPLAASSVDQVFSYSVLQHFARDDFARALQQLAIVSKPGARLLIQMPNRFGLRSIFHIVKRRFQEPSGFDVRYYTPNQLKHQVSMTYGPTSLEVDGFFGLGIQPTDLPLMTKPKQLVIHASEALRRLCYKLPPLKFFADSLYLRALRVKRI